MGRVGGLPGEPPTHDELLTKGASLTPMTPKRPPAGMVLPNAFGLLSMQSFRRTNSGLKRSNSGLKSAPVRTALNCSCILQLIAVSSLSCSSLHREKASDCTRTTCKCSSASARQCCGLWDSWDVGMRAKAASSCLRCVEMGFGRFCAVWGA